MNTRPSENENDAADRLQPHYYDALPSAERLADVVGSDDIPIHFTRTSRFPTVVELKAKHYMNPRLLRICAACFGIHALIALALGGVVPAIVSLVLALVVGVTSVAIDVCCRCRTYAVVDSHAKTLHLPRYRVLVAKDRLAYFTQFASTRIIGREVVACFQLGAVARIGDRYAYFNMATLHSLEFRKLLRSVFGKEFHTFRRISKGN